MTIFSSPSFPSPETIPLGPCSLKLMPRSTQALMITNYRILVTRPCSTNVPLHKTDANFFSARRYLFTSSVDNFTFRNGTCSLKISLGKFSLGRNGDDCCWNQLFTVLGPGVVGQGPILCGQHRQKSGASLTMRKTKHFDNCP